MFGRFLGVWLALLGLASPGATAPAAPPTQTPAASADKAAIERHLKVLNAPMMFFVAKGADNACGPGCSEWIAAEGTIDTASASRLRTILNRLGSRKLPVYFHTPGGSITGAVDMGRLLRERKLAAGVAWTLPQGCDAQRLNDDKCNALKRSGKDLASDWRIDRTQCNSACVYALAGAVVRDVPLGARIGVHQGAVRFFNRGNGRTVPINNTALRQRAQDHLQAENARLRRYLREMGIDTGLLDAAVKISHSTVRYLTREELVQFGIDPRLLVESRWIFEERQQTKAIFKLVAEMPPGSAEFRTTVLRLACLEPSRITVGYARELPPNAPADLFHTVKIVGYDDEVLLAPVGNAAADISRTKYEARAAAISAIFFRTAAAADSIKLMETPGEAKPQEPGRTVKLSTIGLPDSLTTLMSQCSSPLAGVTKPEPVARLPIPAPSMPVGAPVIEP